MSSNHTVTTKVKKVNWEIGKCVFFPSGRYVYDFLTLRIAEQTELLTHNFFGNFAIVNNILKQMESERFLIEKLEGLFDYIEGTIEN